MSLASTLSAVPLVKTCVDYRGKRHAKICERRRSILDKIETINRTTYEYWQQCSMSHSRDEQEAHAASVRELADLNEELAKLGE